MLSPLPQIPSPLPLQLPPWRCSFSQPLTYTGKRTLWWTEVLSSHWCQRMPSSAAYAPGAMMHYILTYVQNISYHFPTSVSILSLQQQQQQQILFRPDLPLCSPACCRNRCFEASVHHVHACMFICTCVCTRMHVHKHYSYSFQFVLKTYKSTSLTHVLCTTCSSHLEIYLSQYFIDQAHC